MTTKTKTALEELRELESGVHNAERTAAEARAALRQRPRRLVAARARLTGLLEAAGAGDAPGADVDKLRAEVADLERELTSETTWTQGTATTEIVDPVARGRHRRALADIDAARAAVVEFIHEHRSQLEADLTDEALAARERLLDAVDALSDAAGAWDAVARRWHGLCEHWVDISRAEIPRNPLPGIARQDVVMVAAQVRGGARDPRGALPMPVRLAPGGDPDTPENPSSLKGWTYVPRVISSEGGLRGA